MSKDEFLKMLRKRLARKLPREKVDELVEYYENYIVNRKLEGFTEAEVLEELGSPLLIAKTILEVNEGKEPVEPAELLHEYELEEAQPKTLLNIQSPWGLAVLAVVGVLVLGIFVKLLGALVSAIMSLVLPVGIVVLVLYLWKKY